MRWINEKDRIRRFAKRHNVDIVGSGGCLFICVVACVRLNANFSIEGTVCVFVCFFSDFYYTYRQLIGWEVGGSGSRLNADIINVEGHTHSQTLALSRCLSPEEVTEFNERWSVAVCFEGELSRSLDRLGVITETSERRVCACLCTCVPTCVLVPPCTCAQVCVWQRARLQRPQGTTRNQLLYKVTSV